MGLPYKGPENPREIGYLIGDIIASFLNNPKFKDGVNFHKNTDIEKPQWVWLKQRNYSYIFS